MAKRNNIISSRKFKIKLKQNQPTCSKSFWLATESLRATINKIRHNHAGSSRRKGEDEKKPELIKEGAPSILQSSSPLLLALIWRKLVGRQHLPALIFLSHKRFASWCKCEEETWRVFSSLLSILRRHRPPASHAQRRGRRMRVLAR